MTETRPTPSPIPIATPTPASASTPTSAPRFRTSSDYRLVVFDRVDDRERTLFAELAADPDFYGVLRPAAAGRTYRAVDRDLALLLLTLAEPGPLPFFARRDGAEADVADLVLDGVLEVEHEGRFVSGPGAAHLLETEREGSAAHPLGALAEEALLLAANLAADPVAGPAPGAAGPEHLAAFLYDFNRLPLDPEWERRLDGRDAVLAFLGAAPGTPLRRNLEARWQLPAEEGPWILFSPRERRQQRPGGGDFKLYVSPRPEALPETFRTLVEVLGRRPRHAFKVGADAAGLLRPDKLLAYFGDLESLLAVARDLEERLAGLPVHGVPFSAPVDAAGLLSWGVDPPASMRPLSWQGPESWRTWVVGRLAALLARGDGATPAEARAFAVARLAREGVDVDRWLPTAALFPAA